MNPFFHDMWFKNKDHHSKIGKRKTAGSALHRIRRHRPAGEERPSENGHLYLFDFSRDSDSNPEF